MINESECEGSRYKFTIENGHPVSCRVKEEIKTESCPFRKEGEKE